MGLECIVTLAADCRVASKENVGALERCFAPGTQIVVAEGHVAPAAQIKFSSAERCAHNPLLLSGMSHPRLRCCRPEAFAGAAQSTAAVQRGADLSFPQHKLLSSSHRVRRIACIVAA